MHVLIFDLVVGLYGMIDNMNARDMQKHIQIIGYLDKSVPVDEVMLPHVQDVIANEEMKVTVEI